MGFNPNRLKVQLRLAVNRLKMLQQKKASISAQQRREIAQLLEKGKEESAKIRVEHIIREDYHIEALEMVEIFCEMLLARFGLIEQSKTCDESISEAACSIIYASALCDVPELPIVKELLGAKYGKEFVQNALHNKNNVVQERLIQKLKIKVPDPKLANRYLTEIAKNYNVAWAGAEEFDEIDSSLIGDSNFDEAFALPTAPSVTKKGGGSGGGGGGGSIALGGSSHQLNYSQNPTPSISHVDNMFPPVPTATIPYQQNNLNNHAPQYPPPTNNQLQDPFYSLEDEKVKGNNGGHNSGNNNGNQSEEVDDGNMPDFDVLA